MSLINPAETLNLCDASDLKRLGVGITVSVSHSTDPDGLYLLALKGRVDRIAIYGTDIRPDPRGGGNVSAGVAVQIEWFLRRTSGSIIEPAAVVSPVTNTQVGAGLQGLLLEARGFFGDGFGLWGRVTIPAPPARLTALLQIQVDVAGQAPGTSVGTFGV